MYICCVEGFLLPASVGVHRQKLRYTGTATTVLAGTQSVPSSFREDETRLGDKLVAGGGSTFDVRWKKVGKVDVLLPVDLPYPLGVIHFIGGLGVGTVPRGAYGPFLEALGQAGFVVLATPIRINEFNHQELACDVAREFRLTYREVEALYGRTVLERTPVFGVGHSLGAKLHGIINCFSDVTDVARRRKANVLISFNNFAASKSIPMLPKLREFMSGLGDKAAVYKDAVKDFGLFSLAEAAAEAAVGWGGFKVPGEFTPPPEVMWNLMEQEYAVRNNMVIEFKTDTIDESSRLAKTLFERFGSDGQLQYVRLTGSHVTPNTPDLTDVDTRDWVAAAARGAGPRAAEAAAVAEARVQSTAALARGELQELQRTVVLYLKTQSIWQTTRSAPERAVFDV